MRDSDQYWEDSTGNTSVKSTYNQLTWVRIDGKIYMRSGHLEDQPFVELDTESCKAKEDFTPWTSEDNLLNWTKSDVQSSIGSEAEGYRYLRPTQMHYHNNELWVMVPYYQDSYTSPVKRLVIEVFEREEGTQHFKKKNEIPLFKEDGLTPFLGAKRRRNEYLDRGMLHKNSKNIVWISGKTIHVFDRVSGTRIHKCCWSGSTHVVFFNPKNKHFCWMDCACYSYLYIFDIKDYDPLS